MNEHLRFRVPQDIDRPGTPDAPYFDVIAPPDYFVARYTGRPLDRHQHEAARAEIAALGYVYDHTIKAWR